MLKHTPKSDHFLPADMLPFLTTLTCQDTLRNPTVMHFLDQSLGEVSFTTRDILNFLYAGPEEWREPGKPAFDWRNVFHTADQLLRLFNQYAEVNTNTYTHIHREREKRLRLPIHVFLAPVVYFSKSPGQIVGLLLQGRAPGSVDRCISLRGLLSGDCRRGLFETERST